MVWKNKTINPFLMNFGSKRTLLGILVVFDSFRLGLELFWFGFVVDLRLYETKYGFPQNFET